MSIKETKERIAVMPLWDSDTDSALLLFGQHNIVLEVPDLVALTESHTALLEAAKDGFAELHLLRTINGLHTTAVDSLEAAIQQAEGTA